MIVKNFLRRTLLLALFTGLIVTGLPAAEGDRVFFSRDFPGSVPEYFEATIDSAGLVSYIEEPDDEPIEFEVRTETARQVFDWAAALDHFGKPLASTRKVAFTGDKVLRYESSTGERTEAKFDHTEAVEARELVRWFLKVAETERHLMELERTFRFDRLGVNKTLAGFEQALNRERVVEPTQFLSILRQISKQKKIMHLARSRAAALVDRIEGIDNSDQD